MLTYFKNLFKKKEKKEPKYCVDCKWIDGEQTWPKCLNPNVRWVRVDLVAGKTTDRIYCDTARKWLLHTDGFNTCGPKAKYFEPK